MRVPCQVDADKLKDYGRKHLINGGYHVKRTECKMSFFKAIYYRFKRSFDVFVGKADAIYWFEDQ